jgi:hypothetical protein
MIDHAVPTLSSCLPDAQFSETHHRVIKASPAAVLHALQELRWLDLTVTKPLVLLRGMGGPSMGSRRMLEHGPVVMLVQTPSYLMGGQIARPWKPRAEVHPEPLTLDLMRGCNDANWLKYGIDFTINGLEGGRTVLTTRTLCEATDERALRSFRRYWTLIRPFSGLIRRDLLRAVALRAESIGER